MTDPERKAALARCPACNSIHTDVCQLVGHVYPVRTTTEEIAVCDAEIAKIEQEGATGEHPAWLIALGTFDWEAEKRAIEREDANA